MSNDKMDGPRRYDNWAEFCVDLYRLFILDSVFNIYVYIFRMDPINIDDLII